MEVNEPEQLSCDRLIAPLIADFRPAPPLWPVRTRLALWLLLQLAIVALVAAFGPRTNLLIKLQDTQFVAGVAGLMSLGVLAAGCALRTAIPGEEIGGGEFLLLLALGAISTALVLREPAQGAISMDQFVAGGTPCMICTILVAAIPWAGLFWAVRRGVPLMGGATGALIGVAAFSFSLAATRMGCAIDDLPHVLVWHAIPAAVGTAISIAVGLVWLQGLKPERISPRRRVTP